jgi:hypothetical protein
MSVVGVCGSIFFFTVPEGLGDQVVQYRLCRDVGAGFIVEVVLMSGT